MKTAEARDAMVARATAALKKYPSFMALPEVEVDLKKAHGIKVGDDREATYVAAMYEVCAVADPIGRRGPFIVGK